MGKAVRKMRERFGVAIAWLMVCVVPGVAMYGCSSFPADVDGGHPGAGFVLTVSTPALVLTAGDSVSATIRSTRTPNFFGSIAYAVTGAPVGLVTTIEPSDVVDVSRLTVTALGSLPSGSYAVTLAATSADAEPRRATLMVSVHNASDTSRTIALVQSAAHSCALTTGGAAYCWGDNSEGQLGIGDTVRDVPTPTLVGGGISWRSIALSKSDGMSCGVSVAGTAYCWGANDVGQLGDGTTMPRLLPSPVVSAMQFTSIAVGGRHACALTDGGVPFCWGASRGGVVGDGTTSTQLTPARAAGSMHFASIVAGGDFTCGLTRDGGAHCWGIGALGQLGDGRGGDSPTPVAVAGDLAFHSLTAGQSSVCGLTFDGTAYCWGYNFFGTLGDGTSALVGGGSRRFAPVAVAGELRFASLSAGFFTTCGVTTTGVGYCWGYNADGAIGDGSFEHRAVPVPINGGFTFRQIAAGTNSSCGVTVAGALYCWGDDLHGGLGDGHVRDTPSPSPVPVIW